MSIRPTASQCRQTPRPGRADPQSCAGQMPGLICNDRETCGRHQRFMAADGRPGMDEAQPMRCGRVSNERACSYYRGIADGQ